MDGRFRPTSRMPLAAVRFRRRLLVGCKAAQQRLHDRRSMRSALGCRRRSGMAASSTSRGRRPGVPRLLSPSTGVLPPPARFGHLYSATGLAPTSHQSSSIDRSGISRKDCPSTATDAIGYDSVDAGTLGTGGRRFEFGPTRLRRSERRAERRARHSCRRSGTTRLSRRLRWMGGPRMFPHPPARQPCRARAPARFPARARRGG
jgi:hypothetical protein